MKFFDWLFSKKTDEVSTVPEPVTGETIRLTTTDECPACSGLRYLGVYKCQCGVILTNDISTLEYWARRGDRDAVARLQAIRRNGVSIDPEGMK